VKPSAWSKVGGGYNDPTDNKFYTPVQETWTLLPTVLDTSDEEWEDDEAYNESSDDEENEKSSSSNFSFCFRKWYKSKPTVKYPEPDFAEFKSIKPYLSPMSHAGYHLDYITWAQYGFDGTRKIPLIKRKNDSQENSSISPKIQKLDAFGNPIQQKQNLFADSAAGKLLNKTRKHVNFQYDYSKTQAAYDQEQEALADYKRSKNEEAVRRQLQAGAENAAQKKADRIARARKAMAVLRGKMEARQFAQDHSAQCPRSWSLVGDHLNL